MSQWNPPDGDPYGQTRATPPVGPPPGYGHAQPRGYGVPQYGQPPSYGQPGYPPPDAESFGIVGTVLALLGGVVLVVSFTALQWFNDLPGGSGGVSFPDIDNAPKAFADVYFSWLAWLFLIVVVVAGVLSSVPSPAMRVFRIIGVVVGITAAGLSFLAVQLSENASYLDYLKHARIGFYFAVAGFILSSIGAAIGPRRV